MPINTVYFGYGIILKNNKVNNAICKKLDLPEDSNDDEVYDELNERIGVLLAEKYPTEIIPDQIFCMTISDAGSFLYLTRYNQSISTHDREIEIGEEGDLNIKLDEVQQAAVAMFKEITRINEKWSWMLVSDFFP